MAQKKHAMRRMRERIGIDMTKKKYQQLLEATRASARRGGVIFKQSRRTRLVKLTFEEDEIIVVYDVQRKTVVTVLPKENEFYKIFGVSNDNNFKNSNRQSNK